MISGSHTTRDWQTHTGNIAVLPVGSFEQHGLHLPLDTDILGAQFFAQFIAQEYEAALLPVLPFGTCNEHSGFRGSFSLRSSTLMQLVRDLAEELEQQNFRILILVNGHGGNFCLPLVTREWNRSDHALKILLVTWWDFCAPTLQESVGLDFHAGEFETSFMLAIAPESVQMSQAQDRAATDVPPLRQSDLNLLGGGHFNREGVIGYPTRATAEKGRAIVASVQENLPPFLQNRLERLRAQPRYAGAAGIALRPMVEDDFAAGMRLKEVAGWNQTWGDWDFLLREAPDSCFVALQNGHIIGTATVFPYERKISWIGMVLVDPDFRRLGVGKMLLQHALQTSGNDCTVKLDATPEGRKLYETLGFTVESELQRWICGAVPMIENKTEKTVRPVDPQDWPTLLALDEQAFGARREALLRYLAENAPTSAWCIEEDGAVRGCVLGRQGTHFHHIGPLIATNFADARILAAKALGTLTGRAVLLDVFDAQSEFINWLSSLGFRSQRPFFRMSQGKTSLPPTPQYSFAICGPEFG